MQGSPTSGSPLIVKNPPCYFLGRCDIGSSISTSSFKLKYTNEEELISFFCPSSNTRNLFFPTTLWKHTTTSFLILLLLPSLVVFYKSPTLALTTDPTPIFVLVYFFTSIPSLTVTTGELMVDLGVEGGVGKIEIAVSTSKHTLDLFFVWKFIPTKKHKQAKNCPGVENQ